ncbi:hypothetical protein OL548_02815 [Lysinibacillus sp. MHQ-1]|nr:hypothetical protein OL548_02815 [Lysinibacillus sp. MHQ-1]
MTRRQLLQTIQQFTDEQWQQSFNIGQSNITMADYFGGLIDHDLHHFFTNSECFTCIGASTWISSI